MNGQFETLHQQFAWEIQINLQKRIKDQYYLGASDHGLYFEIMGYIHVSIFFV